MKIIGIRLKVDFWGGGGGGGGAELVAACA